MGENIVIIARRTGIGHASYLHRVASATKKEHFSMLFEIINLYFEPMV
jgi:hypothetical protein